MDFLDKVKEVASTVAAVSVRKGKELHEITKIKLEIADKQNKVKALYKEIGYEACKAHKAQVDIIESIKDKIDEVDSIEEKIAVLRKNLDEVGNTVNVGVEDVEVADDEAEDADFDEEDVEPIDPIE